MGVVEGKVALITGAGAGIGRAAALLFAAEGAKVVVTNRSETSGLETVRMIQEAGGEGSFCKLDIGVPDDIERAVAFAVETYGRLDCAVNNAFAEPNAWLFSGETSAEVIDTQLMVNLKGTLLCMKHEITAMLPTGGAIVNVSSTAAGRVSPTASVYGAIKAGIEQAGKVAAVEYGDNPGGAIRVNTVQTGATMTDFLKATMEKSPEAADYNISVTPMKRISEPVEQAQACLWLCSEGSSYVTAQVLAVDGGYGAA